MDELKLDLVDCRSVDDTPPWEARTTSVEEKHKLDIYRKAENFNKLTLISGNTIDEDIDTFISNRYGKVGRDRLAMARWLLRKLSLRAAPDVLLELASTKPAELVIATAGAGKTTSLQLALILSKMYDKANNTGRLAPYKVPGTSVELPVILYLNYNKHNVEPIERRHVALVKRVNNLITEQIDDLIESTTVHAFCHKWLTAYHAELGLPEIKIISDADKEKVWNSIIEPRIKKFYGDDEANQVVIKYEQVDSLYVYKTESMLDWDAFFQCAKFIDSGLRDTFVKACINKYDSMKSMLHLMDFTDYLLLFVDAMRTHEDIREKLRDRYRIIIADENQDFTALMNELLLLLHDPAKNQLIAVGDPDQTIYQFKGVSPDNVVNLYNRLDDVDLLGLDTNYRCPSVIVEAAKRVLDMNVLRFRKPIECVKEGGEIIPIPCQYAGQQEERVIDILQKNGEDTWGSTVISYRNNTSAMIMAEELYYANIPFNMLDGSRPFNQLAFRHLMRALEALKMKDDFDLNSGLYRFLPLSKSQWIGILDANRKQRRLHLEDLLMPKALPNGTLEALAILIGVARGLDITPANVYIERIAGLYCRYFYNFLIKTAAQEISATSRKFSVELERAIKFFKRDLTYDYLCKELRQRNRDSINCISLGTFHSLKGLEFDYVFAIDFNDSLFPNFQSIEEHYPENTALEEKESENRLCYVLTTRAIQKLYLLYSDTDPSVYIQILCKGDGEQIVEPVSESLSLSPVSSSGATALSKMSFIKRLTERG